MGDRRWARANTPWAWSLSGSGPGERGESLGATLLYVDGKEVPEGPMRAQAGKFTLFQGWAVCGL